MNNLFDQDAIWMQEALKLAEQASFHDEVPVGAVLIQGEELLAMASNATLAQCDPTAHAEILVLRQGALKLGNPRLKNATLYVTLEPCPMCLGAIIQAQVKRVVFGAYDTQLGAAGSSLNLLHAPNLIWRPDMIGGMYAERAGELLRLFFQKRR
jgi:tRNA(adenine34) deaminase